MVDIALLIAVVIALTELFKRVFNVSGRYLPLISLLLGLIAGIIYLDGALADTILQGIIIGLSASGLFDQSKILSDKEAE